MLCISVIISLISAELRAMICDNLTENLQITILINNLSEEFNAVFSCCIIKLPTSQDISAGIIYDSTDLLAIKFYPRLSSARLIRLSLSFVLLQKYHVYLVMRYTNTIYCINVFLQIHSIHRLFSMTPYYKIPDFIRNLLGWPAKFSLLYFYLTCLFICLIHLPESSRCNAKTRRKPFLAYTS